MLRPRRGGPTGVGRTEAFSDGVFAVAVTLLVFDLAWRPRLPKQSATDSNASESPARPACLPSAM